MLPPNRNNSAPRKLRFQNTAKHSHSNVFTKCINISFLYFPACLHLLTVLEQQAKPLPEEELYQLSTKQEPLKTSGAGEPEPPQQGEVVCRNPLFQNSNLATLIKREKSNPS